MNGTVAVGTMQVDGTPLTVRPIEHADAERLARMFGRLSRESVVYRFFAPVNRLHPSTLGRLVDVDHCRREALVVVDQDEIVAVARYDAVPSSVRHASQDAEIAVTVEDAWQRRGVGRRLARRLGVLATMRGFDTFVARILADNRGALALVHLLAPDAHVTFSGGDYTARIPLTTGEVRRRASCP